jgi:hypothetical protein
MRRLARYTPLPASIRVELDAVAVRIGDLDAHEPPDLGH